MPTIRKLILGLVLVLSCSSLKAQSILIDSLKDVLARKDTRTEDRITATVRLARINGIRDKRTAIGLDQQALALSNTLKEVKYKAIVLTAMVHLYGMSDSMLTAKKVRDSAIYFAEQSKDRVTIGHAWFRKGWLHNLAEEQDSAVKNILQALRYLEGQKAYAYESNAYYFLSTIYGNWNDREKELKYGRLALEKALLSNTPDELCLAYQAMANHFVSIYRDKPNPALTDSALYYNMAGLRIGEVHRERLYSSSTVAITALNIANIYNEFLKNKKDSTIKYVNIALNIAQQTNQQEIVANCYGMLSEFSMAEKKYDEAELLLTFALSALESFPKGSNLTKARIMQAMSDIEEKKGNPKQALVFYKRYVDFYQAAFDAQRLATARKLDAQYESEKKEKELEFLQQKADFNKTLNFFYVSFAIAALLTLIFFFRAYHFRLRSSLQKQQLLATQHEEANLQAMLNETKARQLELENHEAQLQLQLHAEATARLEAEQQLLQERQERLQNELLAGALQVEEKNELLQTLQKKITTHNSADPVLRQMDRIITDSRKMDEEFESAKSDFADIHPEFINRLQERAQEGLTRLDLKYCSYIRMGLSNKEIANRLAVEAKSIRMARYRLKQKLNLQKDESLDMFLSTIV
jgi:DNA-binding CsgD family transcriptional regulator